MKINIKRNIWKIYLKKLYNTSEFTGQEIDDNNEVGKSLHYGVLREKFDEAHKDLKIMKYLGINEIEAEHWK